MHTCTTLAVAKKAFLQLFAQNKFMCVCVCVHIYHPKRCTSAVRGKGHNRCGRREGWLNRRFAVVVQRARAELFHSLNVQILTMKHAGLYELAACEERGDTGPTPCHLFRCRIANCFVNGLTVKSKRDAFIKRDSCQRREQIKPVLGPVNLFILQRTIRPFSLF